MEDKKSFGEFVYKRRKEIGLTQKEFAGKIFVTESAVSKWERGLSYPDITLIRDICQVLCISEHELLTASEDIEARNAEKLAGKYIRMVKRYCNTLGSIYALSLLVCFVCNIAIQHKLSWFFIVLTSEMVAISLTLVPVLVPKKKGLITLGAFTLSLSLLLLTCNIFTGGNWFFIALIPILFGISLIFLPFILNAIWLPEYFTNKKILIYFIIETIFLFAVLVVCNLYTGGGWLFNIAIPITMFSLTLPWGMMFIIRYLKVNGFLKASGCFALAGAFDYYVQPFINTVLNHNIYGFDYNLYNWNHNAVNSNINILIFLFLIGLAIIFAILGVVQLFSKERMNLE